MRERVGFSACATGDWRERNYLMLRRGPYVIGAGIDESVPVEAKTLAGRFVNLFDPELSVHRSISLTPGARVFLLDLDAVKSADAKLLASACKALPAKQSDGKLAWTVEGVGDTSAILLISTAKPPRAIQLEKRLLNSFTYDSTEGLLHIRFSNEARPRELVVEFN